MEKTILIGLVIIGALLLVGCTQNDGLTPEEKELFGDESAIAGQAISLGCKSIKVQSCTASARKPNSFDVTPLRGRAATYSDRCSGSVALDYSCTSSKQLTLCQTKCESSENCVNTQCISRCGNGQVDTGENCVTCPADVLCAAGTICQEGVCISRPSLDATPSVEVVESSTVPEGCSALSSIEQLCNNGDDNCDGQVDEGCDVDNDGYCTTKMEVSGTPNTCSNGGGDCSDLYVFSASVHPGAIEVCGNGLDDNCNGQRDEGC